MEGYTMNTKTLFPKIPTVYALNVVDGLIAHLAERGAEIYTIPGSLVDNYIILPTDKTKGAIIKEVYLNEWSSGSSIRFFTKISKKTQKSIWDLKSF